MAAQRSVTHLDQAIFTSAESIMGQGYRLVSASRGITAEEKRAISTLSPSHQSLCDKSDGAVGLACYPLATGRCCVARTRYAGREQTGRGGKRVLTQIFVLDPQQWTSFGWNPFTVLRVLERANAFDVSSQLTGAMEPLAVRPEVNSDPGRSIASAFDAFGEQAFLYLLTHAMADGCLIVSAVGSAAGPAVMEGVLAALPAAQRASCSFSIGLRFALARRYRLNWTEADAGGIQRVIRGQPITYVDQLHQGVTPPHDVSPWVEMVSDCCRMNRPEQLASLADGEFDDYEPDTLDRVARRQVALNHLQDAAPDELLEALLSDEAPADTEVERRLQARYRAESRDSLITRFSDASEHQVGTYWPRLLSLAAMDAAVRELCSLLARRIEGLEPPGGVSSLPLEETDHAVPCPKPAASGRECA